MPRDFSSASDEVRINYLRKHQSATLRQTQCLMRKWLPPKHNTMTIGKALTKLGEICDESDPDFDGANRRHAFETAEALRRQNPDDEAMHIVGLLHDLGKIMIYFGEEQHFVVGDIYPVGCPVSAVVPFAPKTDDSGSSIYVNGCGLENLIMTWGHDEYMYQVLRASGCSLPQVYLDIIRYHSFYAWHTDGAYCEYESNYDKEVLLPALKKFNACDLYSKNDEHRLNEQECASLWTTYYEPLLARYGLNGYLVW